ncbi:MAG: SH3 domain-containing protein [Bacteroidota bacterium]
MKKNLCLILLCLIAAAVYPQDNFSVNFGQTFARFKYADSKGNADENMSAAIGNAYALNYNKTGSNGLFIRPELGYKKYGAQSSIDDLLLNWSLQYLDLNFGAGYRGTDMKFNPVIGGSLYASFLLKADQTVGRNIYNLKENDDINKMDFGMNLIAGVNYSFSETASILLECRYAIGLRQLEPNQVSTQTQDMKNRAFSLHFGLAFDITGKQAKKATVVDTTIVRPILEMPVAGEKPADAEQVADTVKLQENKADGENTGQFYIVISKSLNMRAGPGTEHKVILAIKKGEKVEVIEKTSDIWWKIRYKDKTGFAYQSLLEKTDN